MIVGDKGKMLRHRLIPDARTRRVRQTAARPGAVRPAITSNGSTPARAVRRPVRISSEHAAHLAEMVQLGNIALRTKEKLYWDAVNLQVHQLTRPTP